MSQNEYVVNDTSQTTLNANDTDDGTCACDKKQCMLGIASIAIGIGGFVLASLL